MTHVLDDQFKNMILGVMRVQTHGSYVYSLVLVRPCPILEIYEARFHMVPSWSGMTPYGCISQHYVKGQSLKN